MINSIQDILRAGAVLDRLCVLSVKQRELRSAEARRVSAIEDAYLRAELDVASLSRGLFPHLVDELFAVHVELWRLENAVRLIEAAGADEAEVVAVGLSIVKRNRERRRLRERLEKAYLEARPSDEYLSFTVGLDGYLDRLAIRVVRGGLNDPVVTQLLSHLNRETGIVATNTALFVRLCAVHKTMTRNRDVVDELALVADTPKELSFALRSMYLLNDERVRLLSEVRRLFPFEWWDCKEYVAYDPPSEWLLGELTWRRA